MPSQPTLTLPKAERIAGKKQVDTLFGGHNHSLSAFPVRLVYVEQDRMEGEAQVKILTSVPKRCFKRAVKRNRVKRQLREAYRRNKHILLERLSSVTDRQMLLAFIWIDNHLCDSATVEHRVVSLLERLTERVDPNNPNNQSTSNTQG